VALLSETHLTHHERFFIPNYHFYWTGCFPGRKGATAVAVGEGIPHNHVDLPPLVSTKATGAWIPTANTERYFQQSICHQAMLGMMQTSLSAEALDISHYWQEI
jgi:hypothetical protein